MYTYENKLKVFDLGMGDIKLDHVNYEYLNSALSAI